jgi:hypothetical protein
LPPTSAKVAVFNRHSIRYSVVDVNGIRLRLCVTDSPERNPTTFVVPLGAGSAIRLAAAQGLCALLQGGGAAFTRPPFAPTPYHRSRLIQLLAVADAIAGGATVRDIAFAIVFPNTTRLEGKDWRESNEQRQTRRFVADAARMIDGGFWRFPCFV